MSKKNSHIDDLFKENLKDATLPTSDLDWAAIEKGISKPSRRFPLLWLWLIIGLSAIGLLGYLLWPVESTQITQNTQRDTSSEQISAPKKGSNEQDVAEVPQNDFGSNDNTDQGTLASKNSDNSIRSIDVFNKNEGNSLIRKQKSTSYYTDKNSNKKGIKETPEKNVKADLRTYVAIEVRRKSLNDLPIGKPEHPFSILNIASSLNWPAISPYSSPWYLGMDAGAVRANKITQTDKAELGTFQSRSNSDQALWSFSYGLQTGYQWKRFQFHTGIQSSRLQFENPSFTYTKYDSFPVLNPRGEIIGYGRINYRDTTITNQRNSISTLTIPFQVNYQVFETSKFSLSLGFQGNTLINTSQTGYSVNPDLLRVPFSSRFSNTVNLQIGGNAFARYQLTQNLFIGVQASYLRQANSLEIRQDYSTKIHQLSLKSGLYYAL